MAYVTLAEFKEYIGIVQPDDVVDDSVLEVALAAAEASIDSYCGRSFSLDTVASTRKYRTNVFGYVLTDDIGSTSGLVVATDDDSDGTAETTWDASDYQLEPGNTGSSKPYWCIRAVGSGCRFPISSTGRYVIHVTAKWGWPAVPAEVHTATLMQAARFFKRRTSPEGVLSNADFGFIRLTRLDPDVEALLTPFRLVISRTV